jgi:hypothetical protein
MSKWKNLKKTGWNEREQIFQYFHDKDRISLQFIEKHCKFSLDLLSRRWCENFEKYHDQTKMKLSTQRERLKTLRHKTVLCNTNTICRTSQVFSCRNIAKAMFTQSEMLDLLCDRDNATYCIFVTFTNHNFWRIAARKLNDANISSKTIDLNRSIRIGAILIIKLETEV